MRVEREVSPERQTATIGLQARVLAGALETKQIEKDILGRIKKDGAYGIPLPAQMTYEHVSLVQRARYANEHRLTLDGWKTKVNTYFQSVTQGPGSEDTKLVLKKLLQGEPITADSFHERYFQKGSKLIQFVADLEENILPEEKKDMPAMPGGMGGMDY